MIAMRLLMDSSSLRRLELMELLNASDDWWTVEEIAQQLKCSVRSIKADIYYYNTFSHHDIKLVTSKHRGVKLILPTAFQMESLYQETLTENLNSQILECLYQEKMDSIEDYAECLFTSTSSIVRSIKQINLFLEKYNLIIQKNPMRIKGPEKQIRYFYGIFFWEKYGSKIEKIDYPNIDKVKYIIQGLEEKIDISLSPFKENKLSIWLLICLDRISKGYILQQYRAPIGANKIILESIGKFIKSLLFNIPKQEIEFMEFYFMNQYVTPEPQANQLTKELLVIFQQIGQFLTSFSEKFSFSLPNKEDVQRSIFHYIVYKREFQGRDFVLVNRTKNTLLNLDKIYRTFIESVVSELEGWRNVEWVTKVKENIAEFLYLLITQWKGLTAQLSQLQAKINVLIISQFGKAHELFLADSLKNYFPNKLECYSLSEKKFQSVEIEVVVTDTQVETVRKNIVDEVPVIGIEYSPNERNWKIIQSILTEINQIKEESSNWLTTYSSFN